MSQQKFQDGDTVEITSGASKGAIGIVIDSAYSRGVLLYLIQRGGGAQWVEEAHLKVPEAGPS